MATLFISDLHLDALRPEPLRRFQVLLAGPARRAEALYILGDLFEAWIGDDDDRPPHPEVLAALADLSATGTPVYVMRGNRDFLMGPEFEAQTGCRLLPDPTVVALYGEATLLMHGDTLCTEDLEYQAFRRQVRDPRWQSGFLARPLAERAALAEKAREGSRMATQGKAEAIMDVSPKTVVETMQAHGVRQLIHGHTHRPAIHRLVLSSGEALRIVLGDWYQTDSVLVLDERGLTLTRVADAGGTRVHHAATSSIVDVQGFHGR
jgi:UDP-2,3-diacylglucosamine hydrolase